MVTRRKKASTRVFAVQRRARKATPPKGGKALPRRKPAKAPKRSTPSKAPPRPTKRPKSPPPRPTKTAKRSRRAASTKAPKGSTRPSSPKQGKGSKRPTSPKLPKLPKHKRSPKPRKIATKRPTKRPKKTAEARDQAHFLKLLSREFKKGKLVLPRYVRRRGKSDLRNTVGPQRDILVNEFWEKLHEGWLENQIRRGFESLVRAYHEDWKLPGTPTLYLRWTFQTRGIKSPMAVGYPPPKKPGKGDRSPIAPFITPTPSAMSVEGAMQRFEKRFDQIGETIEEKRAEAPGAQVFLSHVTLYAYAIAEKP